VSLLSLRSSGRDVEPFKGFGTWKLDDVLDEIVRAATICYQNVALNIQFFRF